MHNCKQTRNVLVDLVLGETPPRQSKDLLSELNGCAACQAEYAEITSALHVSQQALRSAPRSEEFWPGYHNRLQAGLKGLAAGQANTRMHDVKPVSFPSRIWTSLTTLVGTSVRVPLPAALAMLLLVGALFFSVSSGSQANISQVAPPITVETRIVQVPVLQEKVVTKVVYVSEKRPRSGGVQSPGYMELNTTEVTAANSKPAFSLAGFKPADQVNLKIIKGTDQNEK
jgi:anti-sigma factor RsiW